MNALEDWDVSILYLSTKFELDRFTNNGDLLADRILCDRHTDSQTHTHTLTDRQTEVKIWHPHDFEEVLKEKKGGKNLCVDFIGPTALLLNTALNSSCMMKSPTKSTNSPIHSQRTCRLNRKMWQAHLFRGQRWQTATLALWRWKCSVQTKMATLACRIQYLDDRDPFSNTNFPEPTRPPVYTFLESVPLVNQIGGVHRLLEAPHRVSFVFR